jgi:hypothetical protein
MNPASSAHKDARLLKTPKRIDPNFMTSNLSANSSQIKLKGKIFAKSLQNQHASYTYLEFKKRDSPTQRKVSPR